MNEKIEYAESFIETGKYEKAIDFLNEIIDADQNIKAYQLRGFAYYCMRDMNAAIPDLKYVIDHDKQADLANYYLSQIYLQMADLNEAKKYIESALSIDNENAEFLADYVTIEQTLKNYEHSIELCDKILTDIPDSSFALNARGYANLCLNKVDDAIVDFNKAVSENRMDFVGWNNLGIAYLKKGELENSFKYFQESLRQYKMNPDAYGYIGLLNYKTGDFNKAFQYLNRAIELDYVNINAIKCRALVFFAMKESDKAKADLKRLEEIGYKVSEDSDLSDLMNQMGMQTQL